MIFEGVHFNVPVIMTMTREEFEAKHLDLLWADRDEATRKKMLGQVYDIIAKPGKKSQK